MCAKLLQARGFETTFTVQSGLKLANKEHQRHLDKTLPLYQRVSRMSFFPGGCLGGAGGKKEPEKGRLCRAARAKKLSFDWIVEEQQTCLSCLQVKGWGLASEREDVSQAMEFKRAHSDCRDGFFGTA